MSWQGATIQAMRAIASEADNLGYGHFWIQEGWGLEALSTAGYLLGATKRIRVGSGILGIYSRSAALIGMSCVTLDQIAPGRFMLGVGSSGRALVQDWHGMGFDKPLVRTREYVDVVKRVVKAEPIDYEGRTVSVKRFRLFAKPTERDLEIYVAAIGEKNLRLAGEIADGAILQMYPMSRLHKAMELLNGKEAFAYYRVRVVDSKEEEKKARSQIARHIAFYIASMGTYYAQNLSKLGYSKDVQEVSRAKAHSGTREAAAAVSESLIEELSFIGPPEYVLEKISKKIPERVHPVFDFSTTSPADTLDAVKTLGSVASRIA